eukprot:TRINITY_DN3629_c1_g1_i3.p1 TRINITY_DN3629_c1_g1~~TRINITY_DN3629_c1_g1_i3.p1  ORF type:complete len:365 (-),score=28.26 TRINITY_DN3629_c1_g1_i3:258-1352(-)
MSQLFRLHNIMSRVQTTVLYSIAIVVLTAFQLVISGSVDPHTLDEPFPGWQGETFVPEKTFGKDKTNATWVQKISDSPRAFVFHNFLSPQEANHLIRRAGMQMLRSTVAPQDKKNKHGVVDDIRTSYGTFLHRYSDPIVEGIEERLAKYTKLPVSHQESIQVLRYTYGQEYRAHHDGFNRYITVVMFLTDVEEGGETVFPYGKWIDPEMVHSMDDATSCGKGLLGMKPKKGDAVMFYDKFDNGTDDKSSIHTACPVLKGLKWSAPVWIHLEPFRPEELDNEKYLHQRIEDPGYCVDSQQTCPAWAQAGECNKNQQYMALHCRLSCGLCKKCEQGDRECYLENRDRAGYLNLFDEISSLTGVAEF